MDRAAPTRWHESPRRVLLLLAAAAVAAVLLAAKAWWIGPFVAARGIGTFLVLLAFLVGVEIARRALGLRVGNLLLAAPVLAVVVVSLVLTPMAHEVEGLARRLPHPAEGERVELVTPRPFEANHPSSRIVWAYAEGTDLEALTRAAAQAFRDDGWEVRGFLAPGDTNAGNPVDYGYFYADKWGFRASCSLGERPGQPGPTMGCTLTT